MLYSNINPEKSYWMGADGFTWWVGQVQGNGAKKLNKDLSVSDGPIDETKSNRVKVRIIGYHSSKWDELPVEDLPWAQVMMPATFPQSSGLGSSHQLDLGTYVIGFFLDGLNCQQPIVMGVIGDIATGNLKKFKKSNLITDNPEQPGFNNILSPKADNTNQTVGSLGWTTPSNIAQAAKNVGYGLGKDITSFGAGITLYNVGGPSYRDLEMFQKKEKQVSLASPCGTETQEKVDQTLGDLFRFLKGIKKINNQYVNKYTGEVVDFVGKISGFIGRFQNIVADILGSVKTLIINQIKTLVRNLINDILNPIAESLIPARELSDQLLNLVTCLVDNILKSLLQFIANIILSLIENVVNAAFCLVQGVVNSILSAITSAVSGALQVIQGVVSIIGQGGDLISNLASNLADFIGTICGGLNCQVDASRYDMKTGEMQPRSLFGSSDAIINTDFLNNIDAPQLFDADGNLVQGTLNCNADNLAFLSCPPQIALLGLNGGAGTPSILPVIDSFGRLISAIIQNPGSNITSFTSAIVTSCNGFGSGAQVQPVIDNGQVVDIIITNPGAGYPNFDKTADNLDENKVISADSPNFIGVLIGLTVTNVGSGYDENTKIIVNDKECGIPTITDGTITSVTSTCNGTVVNSLPDVQVIGNGTGAKIVPILKFAPRDQAETLAYQYNIPIEQIDCPGHPQGN